MVKKNSYTMFIDGVEFQHEMEHVEYGCTVYPDLEKMKIYNPCLESCGVVKVTVTEEEWVVPQDWSKGEVTTYDPKDPKNLDTKANLLKHAEDRLEYLKAKVSRQEQHINKIKGDSYGKN